MNPQKTCQYILIAILFSLFVGNIQTLFSDKITLDNGNTLEGIVTSEEEDSVTMKIEGGSTDIPRTRIKNIKHEALDEAKFYSPEEIYLKQRNKLRISRKYDELFTVAQEAMTQSTSKLALEDIEWLSRSASNEVKSKADQFLSSLLSNYPIAVLGFKNESIDAEMDSLARGLTEMVSSDLQSLGHLKILERKRLRELLEEIDFSASGYIDPQTATSHGKIKGAKLAILGEVTKVTDQIKLGVRIVNIETSTVLYSSSVDGSENKIFLLEKNLVSDLLNKGLNKPIDQDKNFILENKKTDLKGAEAVKLFGKSLYLYESGKVDEAKGFAKSAIDIVPDFNLASDLLSEISQELNKARILKDQVAKAAIESKLAEVKKTENHPNGSAKFQAWYDLGWVQMQNNLPQDAVQSFVSAIEWDEYTQLFMIWESSKEGYVGFEFNDPLIENDIGKIEWVDPNGPAGIAGIHEGDILSKFNGVILKNNIELAREISKLNVGSLVGVEILTEKEWGKRTKNSIKLLIAEVPPKEIIRRSSLGSERCISDLAFDNLFYCWYVLGKYKEIISWGKIYLKAFSNNLRFKSGLTVYLAAAVQIDNNSTGDKGIGVCFYASLDNLRISSIQKDSLKELIPENSNLVSVNGKLVKNYLEFKKLVRGYRIGEKVTITLETSEGSKVIEVEVIKNPIQIFTAPLDVQRLRLM